MKNLLSQVNSPQELRALQEGELPEFCDQVRSFLINTVSKTGGHLASNLGSVEFTVALHYAFNTPEDILVWDVGHQTYTHKVITGRRKQLFSLRAHKGVSAFIDPKENPIYDSFSAGHAGNAVSAALGMARAEPNRKTVAIIGDGSMTCGLTYEALNNLGSSKENLLIVLNDNAMSISKNVGGISQYLNKAWGGKFYNQLKANFKSTFEQEKTILKLAHRLEGYLKSSFSTSGIFEDLGIDYFGPINGHDVINLVATLKQLQAIEGPKILHLVTQKGYGYSFAENDPIKYHGVSKFEPLVEIESKLDLISSSALLNREVNYSEVFGAWLVDQASLDKKNFLAITPAMSEGSCMKALEVNFPTYFVDVGIAEGHALTFAGGYASCTGKTAVVGIYSTFLQRGYDQLIHDLAIHNLPVILAVDRAGLVVDGPTHHGAFDLAYLNCVPNLTIMAPSSGDELYSMLDFAFKLRTLVAVRYPRAKGGVFTGKANNLLLGKARKVMHAQSAKAAKVAILSFGSVLGLSQSLANSLNASLWDMRFVKPLDLEVLANVSSEYDYLVIVEEGVIKGGAGSAVLQAMVEKGLSFNFSRVLQFGLPSEKFIEGGQRESLLESYGFSEEKLLSLVRTRFPELFTS